jgi:beta-galactosidase
VEVGHVYRNLVVHDDFTLENRFGFTYADEFDGEWELVEDGVPVRREPFAVPHIAPLSRGGLGLPKFIAKDGRETFVNISFKLKEDTLWAKKGWKVSRNQIALVSRNPRVGAGVSVVAVKPIFVQDDKTITASAGGTRAVFCRRSGTLCELTMNGMTILKDPVSGVVAGPRLTCFRAFTDNDIWLRGRNLEDKGNFYLSGLSQLRYHAHPAMVEGKTLRFKVDVTGSKSAGFTHETEWTFDADGAVLVRNTVTPRGTMPSALPRLGLSFKLAKALEKMRYYGRGPRENYIDRKTASFFGVYDSTVTEQFEDYVRPQDNGYKCDVRWAEFRDSAGNGVRFSASQPLFMQALHYSAEDLEFSRHRNGQQRFRAPLVKRDEVCLNLDVRQLGLGGASCGPRPMDKYIFPIQREEWVLKMEPVCGARVGPL